MKDQYKVDVRLECTVCGSADHFEHNEDKTYIKCNLCGREYFGGYAELKECNQQKIDDSIAEMKHEVTKDVKDELQKMLKNAFGDSKHIKFK